MANQKIKDPNELIRMFDEGKTAVEIAAHFGISVRQVHRCKKDYSNASYETKVEREQIKKELQKSNDTQILKITEMTKRWTKPVLIAIYKIDSYQAMYLKDKTMKFDIDCEEEHRIIYKMFESIYNKHGFLPNEEIMVYEFNSLVNNYIKEGSNLNVVDIEDEFNNIIYDISYDKTFLSEIVDKYNGYLTILNLLSTSVDLCRNNCEYLTLKNKFDEAYNSLTLPHEGRNEIVTMDSTLKPMASKMFPFFVKEINDNIKGLPTGVNILCGLTGSGKTMACVNQEVFLAKQGIPSLHFVLGDLTADEYQSRILAHLSQQDCWKIIMNENLKNELLLSYKDILKYINVCVVTEGITVDGYINKINKYRNTCKDNNCPVPSFIVFDYDDLIDTKSSDEWKRAEEVYKPLQTYGMENFVSILCVAQPTKEAEMSIRAGNREMVLTDISGGRKKANIAAVAIGFSINKADAEKENDKLKSVTCKVLKGRNGGYGTRKELFFDGNKCTYHEGLNTLSNEALEEYEPLPFSECV